MTCEKARHCGSVNKFPAFGFIVYSKKKHSFDYDDSYQHNIPKHDRELRKKCSQLQELRRPTSGHGGSIRLLQLEAPASTRIPKNSAKKHLTYVDNFLSDTVLA